MTTIPGPTLGVVGGGQLGRMLAEAAAPLGVDVVVLDPTPDCPAARVADQIVGDFDDAEAVSDLAARSDALTLEIELADPDLLSAASEEAGIPVHPAPRSLRITRDKLVEKRALAEANVPVPPFRPVATPADLTDAIEEFGAVMLKRRTGGYDGRGNVPVESSEEAEAREALAEIGLDDAERGSDAVAVAESFVDFERELSVIGARGADGIRTFTPGENVHREEILRETVVPARTTSGVRERARDVARDVLDLLEGRGVFGIELFETSDGEVLVNEIAPRPHNSGHWTIEGALTSQFEQHVRAVLGWPLGATARRGPTAMANVLGDGSKSRPARLTGVDAIFETPGAAFHWYGKHEVRPLRKMGHVTAVTTDEDENEDDLLRRVRDLRRGLTFGD